MYYENRRIVNVLVDIRSNIEYRIKNIELRTKNAEYRTSNNEYRSGEYTPRLLLKLKTDKPPNQCPTAKAAQNKPSE